MFSLAFVARTVVVASLFLSTCQGFVQRSANGAWRRFGIVESSPPFMRWGAFKQHKGESDLDFIRRITSAGADASQESEQEPTQEKKRGKYQRVEEWDAERKANGTMSWEEKVQYEGQRYGNQYRQNEILQRNLNLW